MIGNLTGPTSTPLIIPNIAFATSIPAPVFKKLKYIQKITQFAYFKEEPTENLVRKNVLNYILLTEGHEQLDIFF